MFIKRPQGTSILRPAKGLLALVILMGLLRFRDKATQGSTDQWVLPLARRMSRDGGDHYWPENNDAGGLESYATSRPFNAGELVSSSKLSWSQLNVCVQAR